MENKSRMSREERAKQFMPFAALKGHMEALHRKEKIIVEKMELSEELQDELSRKLFSVKNGTMITVVYFCKGEYLKVTGLVARMDETARILRVVNTKIPFDDIYDLQISEREKDDHI